jgi:hypothetical protein
MEAYLENLKAKINGEVCYTDLHKAFLCGLVNEAAAEHAADPKGGRSF